jgi:hypothetical protein
MLILTLLKLSRTCASSHGHYFRLLKTTFYKISLASLS